MQDAAICAQVTCSVLVLAPCVQGTGKTTVALRLAKIAVALSIPRAGAALVKLGKEDFEGEYLGGTAPKAQQTLEGCIGKVCACVRWATAGARGV